MSGDPSHEITTDANVRPPDAQALPLSPAPPDVVRQQPAIQSATDILAQLDRVLDGTPPHSLMCRPLKRSIIASAAAEIRRLRVAVRAHGNSGQTETTP